MIVAIGSKNPVKINASKQGFQAVWPELEVEVLGFDISSGVSDQPMSDAESIKGSKARAEGALRAHPESAYGVGIEGGLAQINQRWFDGAWVTIMNRAGKESLAQTVRIPVADRIMTGIFAGKELGDVIDEIYSQQNMKQAGGYINEITNGLIDRTAMNRDAVISALSMYMHPDLFSIP